MSEKEKNELIFTLWSVLIHIMNVVFTVFCVSMLSIIENSELLTPLGYILLFRFFVVMVLWIMVKNDYDFSTKPRKLSTLEKAQRMINMGEYKRQLTEDKAELKRRKEISRELKYIERAIVLDAKNGYRETSYNLPVEYCEKDVELYLQNHGFKAEIDRNNGYVYRTADLHFCYPLHIEW